MKVEFNDQGSVSVITVTSSVFEFRRHNRAIDVAFLLTPEMTSQSSGFFHYENDFKWQDNARPPGLQTSDQGG